MASVTIGSTTYTVYSDVAAADEYFNGSISFATWNALTADEKARSLVEATRLIDRQSWQGEKAETSPEQELEFGRTGLTDCAGNDVTVAESLELAVEASQLLALDLSQSSNQITNQSTENTTKRLKADTVEIEYFRPTAGQPTRFAQPVMELLGCFLAGSLSISGSIDSGTDGTALNNDFGFTDGF